MSEEIRPNWQSIYDLFLKLDEILVNESNEKNMSFGDIDIVFSMLKDKIDRNKMQAYFAYLVSETTQNNDTVNPGVQ